MTEALAPEREQRTGAAPTRLPWGVCAVAHGDWVIFLDLARNRYRAVALGDMAVPLDQHGPDAARTAASQHAALLREGLVTVRTEDAQPVAKPPGARVGWRDLMGVIGVCVWAGRVVQRGALLRAFCRLSELKARVTPSADNRALAARAQERFAAARIWIPAAYVCLFDSLALMRFLLARDVRADLVFGVRSRPFAAHCWVEVEGRILDAGGEDCLSFAEIARV